MAFLDVLTERRNNIWSQAQAILATAEGEKRELTADEDAAFTRASDDMTSVRGQIDRIIAAETANRAAEDALTLALGSKRQAPGEQQGGENSVGEQLRQLARGERRAVEVAATPGAAKRALNRLTPAAGGAAVPVNMYDQLVQHMVDTAGVLQAGPTVLETDSGEQIDVPVTTSFGTAVLTTEGAAFTGTDPAFAKRTLSAYKYAELVQVSRELVDDAVFDLEAFVAQIGGQNVGLALGADLAVGNGASKPAGIMTTATVGVTGGAGVVGAFTADNLIDLFYSVIGPYRNSPSAGWLFRDASLAMLRKLKDGAGRYLFDPATIVGQPDSILGKAIYSDPNVAATALGAKSVGFGDFSKYWVRLAGGVRFERSDDYAFNTDMVTFKVVARGDGLLIDQTGAFKAFAGNAA